MTLVLVIWVLSAQFVGGRARDEGCAGSRRRTSTPLEHCQGTLQQGKPAFAGVQLRQASHHPHHPAREIVRKKYSSVSDFLNWNVPNWPQQYFSEKK